MKKVIIIVLMLSMVVLMGCGGTTEADDSKRIEIDAEMKVKNVTAIISSVTVKDDTIKIPIRWQHWGASNDKIHFSVLAFPAVYQGDAHLEMTSGEESVYKPVAQGVDGWVDLEYKLIDKETPVTIKVIATTDNMEEGSVTVDIK